MTVLLIVTVASLLLAAMMSVVAWRLAGAERRRSDARVAALAAEIHEIKGDVGLVQEGAYNPWDLAYNSHREPPHSNLFTAHQRRSGRRPLATFIVGAFAVGAVGAMAIVLPRTLARARRVTPAAASISSPLPLELVALGHERIGTQLTVRGVVRNPSTGTPIDLLTAVVIVIAPDGEYLATARAAVETPALQPGGETAFAVTVPGAADVGRYRVSFRTGNRLVPHLDRRHES
jgi:hypothetical protein